MAKNNPLVSVIIPVWNAEKSIERLIQNLSDQTYQNLEIIAIDDGSSDNSLRTLRELAKKDSRLKVFHQDNAGVSATRNRGIELATGKYLVFIDSDDEIAPEYIKKMVQAMEDNPQAVLALTSKCYNKLLEGKTVNAFTEPRRARRKNEKLSDYVIYLMVLDGRMYSMTSKIFRADIVRKHQLRLELGRDFAEDTKFTIDYLSSQDGEIIEILEPLYIYNFGTDTSIVRQSSTDWQNWEKSYQELEDWARSENNGKLSIHTRLLLMLIRLRWHISHFKANRRAKASASAKV